jgi:hypothetical protein
MQMQWSAVYAILLIDVELPNYDAYVVWRKDSRHCPLTVLELALDEAVGFECFRRFKVAPGKAYWTNWRPLPSVAVRS